MTKRRLLTVLVLVALVVALGAGWWISTSSSRPEVATATATTQALDVVVNAPGSLAAATAPTVTAPTNGVLQRVDVADGQQVTQGQVLGMLDPQPLDQAVAQARAQ